MKELSVISGFVTYLGRSAWGSLQLRVDNQPADYPTGANVALGEHVALVGHAGGHFKAIALRNDSTDLIYRNTTTTVRQLRKFMLGAFAFLIVCGLVCVPAYFTVQHFEVLSRTDMLKYYDQEEAAGMTMLISGFIGVISGGLALAYAVMYFRQRNLEEKVNELFRETPAVKESLHAAPVEVEIVPNPAAQTEVNRFCGNCGTAIPAQNKFCSRCGHAAD